LRFAQYVRLLWPALAAGRTGIIEMASIPFPRYRLYDHQRDGDGWVARHTIGVTFCGDEFGELPALYRQS
jgi:hypothetical protein